MGFSFAVKAIALLLVLFVSSVIPNAAGEGDGAAEHQRRDVNSFNTRRANMNDYMEYILRDTADWMRKGGVVPFDLPDLREGFSYKPLLIEYSGWVDLSKGRLHDIERVVRGGDCFMSYDRMLMRIEANIALSSITFTYDYVTTIMGLGMFDGYVEGYAENIVIHCDFLIDMYDFYIFMQDFEVTSIGKIDVRLRGNLLTDWIGNIMIDIITALFRKTITEMVSERVKVFVQATLDEINANGIAGNHNSRVMFETLRAAMEKQFGIQLPDEANDVMDDGLRLRPQLVMRKDE